jgi:hypothetical protein
MSSTLNNNNNLINNNNNNNNKLNTDHIGSSLDELLISDDILDEVTVIAKERVKQWLKQAPMLIPLDKLKQVKSNNK